MSADTIDTLVFFLFLTIVVVLLGLAAYQLGKSHTKEELSNKLEETEHKLDKLTGEYINARARGDLWRSHAMYGDTPKKILKESGSCLDPRDVEFVRHVLDLRLVPTPDAKVPQVNGQSDPSSSQSSTSTDSPS